MIKTLYVRHITNLYNCSARTRFFLFVDYIFPPRVFSLSRTFSSICPQYEVEYKFLSQLENENGSNFYQWR